VVTFHIVIGPLAQEELDELRTYDHRTIRDALALHLSRDALKRGKNRKRLALVPAELLPELEMLFDGPVPEAWQLRVREFRVIYVAVGMTVYVLRITKKGRRTTREALS
jgi:hypothetical protein